MNYVVIFAGGTGQRMGSTSLPKQFLIIHNKPIIVHTIEKFNNCEEIDGIIVVCIASCINKMKKLIKGFKLSKVIKVVSGGKCCQDSIFNGLQALSKIAKKKDMVLIHDGVRPIIDNETIINNINCVKKHGTSITVAKSVETILLVNDKKNVIDTCNRDMCYLGRAPQCFYFDTIYNLHLKAIKENKHDFIDSATMMKYYGNKVHITYGSNLNIKVTTPIDYYILKAILDSNDRGQNKNEK